MDVEVDLQKHFFIHRIAAIAVLVTVSGSLAQEVVEEKVRLKRMVGTVELRSGASAKWRPGRVDMLLKTGWDIRTYLESEAEVEFQTGSVIRVGENSVVTLSALQQNTSVNATRSRVTVASGELWGNVKKLVDNRSRFVFETPTATAAIRGTRLGLKVKKGEVALDVYDGLVMLKKVGSNKPVAVMSSTRAVAKMDQDEIEVYRFTPESAKNPSIDPALAGQEPFVDPFIVEIDSLKKEKEKEEGPQAPKDSVGTAPTGLMLEILYPKADQVLTEAEAVVTGQTTPGAIAFVGKDEAAVGSDGLFSALVALKPGANTIPVRAARGAESADKSISVKYQPPLQLEIKNATDGMEVMAADFELDIEVTEGAKFSVNGKEGATALDLKSGPNPVTVKAWDQYGSTEEKSLNIVYRLDIKATLHVSSPQEGAKVERPEVSVAGTATPGASVTVNDMRVSVTASGSFNYTVPLPDEPGEYVISVNAQIGDVEQTVERTIEYVPPKTPLTLTVTSPAEGQTVVRRILTVSGKTGTHATVTVNDAPVKVSPVGLFSKDITLSERDIGEYELEITAADEEDEISKTITVQVDITSPQVNTSAPTVQFQGQLLKATRNATVTVQASDHTPDDEITVVFANNGSKEEYVMESGEAEQMELQEGKNTYAVYAFDKAGNMSNTIQGVVYYLPGPLEIEFLDPSDNPHVIRGLPPMPRDVDNPRLELEIEIDDGVGGVPETIKYCRVRGNGQDILLHNNNDYTFTGEVELAINQTNTFTVHVEDMAGSVQTKMLTVRFSR